MTRPTITMLLTLSVLIWISTAGCSDDEAQVVDLNRVLEIFDKVATAKAEDAAGATEAGEARIEPVSRSDPRKTQEFLRRFADELNKAKLVSTPLGVRFLQEGAIQGFEDPNKNNNKDAREPGVFKIVFDAENRRIIAEQDVAGRTYRRDHHYYHSHYYGHSFGPYIYGRMWYSQRDYYSHRGRSRPNYSRVTMSPRSYHSQAVNRATRARSSARGGSRGFRGGK